MEGLLPRVSLEKDGLSTSLMYKYTTPVLLRNSSNSGYIKLAGIQKKYILYVQKSLIMEFVMIPIVNVAFIVSMHMNNTLPEINIVEISHSKNIGLIEWFYKEDNDYLYLYMKGRDVNIVRTLLKTPFNTYIGDIINVSDPGGLIPVSTVS